EISSTTPNSSRPTVRNFDNSLATNEKQSDGSAVSGPELTTEPSGHKSFTEKGVTSAPDGWTAEMQENGGSKKIPADPAQTSPGQPPETRLGHIPLEKMLDEIRQVFPNAQIIPDDQPPPAEPDQSQFPF